MAPKKQGAENAESSIGNSDSSHSPVFRSSQQLPHALLLQPSLLAIRRLNIGIGGQSRSQPDRAIEAPGGLAY
jgi:hypothetical protein